MRIFQHKNKYSILVLRYLLQSITAFKPVLSRADMLDPTVRQMYFSRGIGRNADIPDYLSGISFPVAPYDTVW